MTGKINWSRVIICGLLTGVIWTVLSAVSTWYLGADFNAAVPGNKIFAPTAGLAAFLFVLNLIGGVWAIWLYASIRPRYGAGAKTAVWVGCSWWIVTSLADATWGSFGFVPVRALVPVMAISLPELIVAAIVGAWLYRE